MLYHVHHAGLQLSNFNEVTLFCAFCSCYEIKVLKLFFFLQMLLYQLKFSIYRKIPYGERAFSKTFSWERWGGGGLYSEGLYMEEYLRFENAIFCSCKCNFLKFSAHNMSLLLIFFSLFYFNNVLTTVNTTLYS